VKDHSQTPRKHLTQDSSDQFDGPEDDRRERAFERRPRVRRWRLTKLAFWLSLPALIVWMAPTIVARTPLFNNILRNAIGSFDGEIETGGASLGWLSPVRLRDIVIRDAEGNEVVAVPQVESERSLLGLLTHASDPGVFRVIEPHVNFKLRRDGSNLEDLLASFPKKESSAARPDLSIEVIDATLVLTDEVAGATWRAERLLARVDAPGNPRAPLEIKLETRIRADDNPDLKQGFGPRSLTKTNFANEAPDSPATEAAPSGSLTAEFIWSPATEQQSEAGATAGKGQIQLASNTLPLEFVAAWLRRFVEPQMNLAGTLSMRGSYAWSTDDSSARPTLNHSLTLESLDARQLDLTAPRWLHRDRLRIPQLGGHGRVRLQGQQLELQDVDLDAGFARLQASGATDLEELQGGLVSQASGQGVRRTSAPTSAHDAESSPVESAATMGSYELRGELDLARLSQLLPETLRIREGTEITSGTLTVTLSSREEKDGRHWDGKLESGNLTAENLGRRVTWEQPIQIQFAAFRDSAGFVIERLDCVSSFLQADARGTLDDGQLSLRGDLQKLAEELNRFVDLGSSQLAGKLRGDLTWRRPANDQINVEGALRLEQLQLALGNARPWHEELLVAKLTARASTSGASVSRLEAADLDVTAGKDSLNVKLTEAVAAPSASTVWPVQGRLVGHLEHWLPRVQMWLPLTGWTLAGAADVTFAGRCSTQEIQCDEGQLNLTNLQARGPGWNIVEPQVKLEIAGEWNRAQGRILSPGLTFTSSALAMRAENVSVAHGEPGLRMAATVGFRSDLARLAGWTHEAGQPVAWNVGGMTAGQVKLTQSGAATSAEWSMEVEKLTYAVPAQAYQAQPGPIPGAPGRIVPATAAGPAFKTVWYEPKLRVTGQGKYDGENGSLDVERCDVSADDLQVIAKGTVTELTGPCVVDLEGELGYDLESLTSRFRQQLGPSVEIRGRDSQPFVLRGPLRNVSLASVAAEPDNRFTTTGGRAADSHWPPADLTGEAGLRWESIVAYGLPIGPGEIQGKLSQGAIDFKPLDVKVSEGHVRLSPRLLFEERGPVLVAQPGLALEDLRISPEMCAQWLKFVLPVMAEATQVDGRMSLSLDEVATVPVAEPLEGEVRGTLDVRSVQVGPGPLSRELISLAQIIQSVVQKQPAATDTGTQQPRTWVEMPAQRIPFHWKDHRVYHQGLQMAVKDVMIVTRGSVGVDQSIDLLAEVPVRDEWLASNRYLQSLKGQKLQVPISGTLTAPRLDRRALQQLASQTVTGAARGALEQEVNRGFEKLIRPRGEAPAPGTQPAQPPGTPPPSAPPSTAPTFPFLPKLPFQSQP